MKKLNTIMAVALAATFTTSAFAAVPIIAEGVISGVPGLPTGYNYTSKGGLVIDGTATIGGMNTIVDSFALTGGSDTLDVDKFWSAFIGDPNSPESFFNYAAAKPLIEELVYTVEGKTFHAEVVGEFVGVDGTTYTDQGNGIYLNEDGDSIVYQNGQPVAVDFNSQLQLDQMDTSTIVTPVTAGYHEADDASFTSVTTDWSQVDSFSGSNGKVMLGDLDQRGLAARNVLEGLGFLGIQTGTFGEETSIYTYGTRTDAQIKSAVLTNSDAIKANAALASVDGQAYSNAVNLLKKIADYNVEENILDVDKATKVLAALIDHHNNFLSASLRAEAEKLKQIMQNNAYLTTASILGQTSAFVCESQLTTGDITTACSAHGKAFKTINTNVETNGLGNVIDNNAALVALSTFVTNLVDFDLTSSSYVAVDAADDIKGDFGIISVADTVSQGSIASWNDSDAEDLFGFDATFEFVTVLDGNSSTESAEFE